MWPQLIIYRELETPKNVDILLGVSLDKKLKLSFVFIAALWRCRGRPLKEKKDQLQIARHVKILAALMACE